MRKKKVEATKNKSNIFYDHDSLEEASKFAFQNTASFGKDDVRDLKAVIGVLPLRHQALIDAIRRFQKTEAELGAAILTPGQQFNLAVIDIFVEKAQFVLTRRSNILFFLGSVSIISVFIILIGTYFLTRQISTIATDDIPTNVLILKIFQPIALSAYIYVAVKYLISLGRSFLHEASVLRERRHSLRFGRLFAYLKKGDVELKDLQDSFEWNKIVDTSFLDVNPSAIAETLLHKVVEAIAKTPAETIKALVDNASKVTKAKSEKSSIKG